MGDDGEEFGSPEIEAKETVARSKWVKRSGIHSGIDGFQQTQLFNRTRLRDGSTGWDRQDDR